MVAWNRKQMPPYSSTFYWETKLMAGVNQVQLWRRRGYRQQHAERGRGYKTSWDKSLVTCREWVVIE